MSETVSIYVSAIALFDEHAANVFKICSIL